MTRKPTEMLIASSMPCSSPAFADLSAAILGAGKAVRFRARGASMRPLLRDGDLLLVRPVDARALRVGDVVLFRTAHGSTLVHRIIDREATRQGTRFLVQGDAMWWDDGLIPAAQIYGRVAAIDRDGVHLNLDRPLLRWLGWLAAWRSRWNLGRGQRLRRARQLVKRLPHLSRYLA